MCQTHAKPKMDRTIKHAQATKRWGKVTECSEAAGLSGKRCINSSFCSNKNLRFQWLSSRSPPTDGSTVFPLKDIAYCALRSRHCKCQPSRLWNASPYVSAYHSACPEILHTVWKLKFQLPCWHISSQINEWRTQAFFFGGGGVSTNSVEDRERGSGSVAPYSGVLEAAVIWYNKFHFI